MVRSQQMLQAWGPWGQKPDGKLDRMVDALVWLVHDDVQQPLHFPRNPLWLMMTALRAPIGLASVSRWRTTLRFGHMLSRWRWSSGMGSTAGRKNTMVTGPKARAHTCCSALPGKTNSQGDYE